MRVIDVDKLMDDFRDTITKNSTTFDWISLINRQPEINGWIPVSERLPKNEERVLICADRKCFNGKVIQITTTAMYEDGTMHTGNSAYSWDDCDFKYCEDTDDYIISEGWWEQNMYCEEFGVVDDFVTHWMPLPDHPIVR